MVNKNILICAEEDQEKPAREMGKLLEQEGCKVSYLIDGKSGPELEKAFEDLLVADPNVFAQQPNVILFNNWYAKSRFRSSISAHVPVGTQGTFISYGTGATAIDVYSYFNFDGNGKCKPAGEIEKGDIPLAGLLEQAIGRASEVAEKNRPSEPVKAPRAVAAPDSAKRDVRPVLVTGKQSDVTYLHEHGCSKEELDYYPSTNWLDDFGNGLLKRKNSSLVMVRVENEQDMALVEQAKHVACEMTKNGGPICFAWYKDFPTHDGRGAFYRSSSVDGNVCVFRDGKEVGQRTLTSDGPSEINALRKCIRVCGEVCEVHGIESNIKNVKLPVLGQEEPAPIATAPSAIAQVIGGNSAPAPVPAVKSLKEQVREANAHYVRQLQDGQTLSGERMQRLAKALKNNIPTISEEKAKKREGQYAEVTTPDGKLIPEKIPDIFQYAIGITADQKKEIVATLKLPLVIDKGVL